MQARERANFRTFDIAMTTKLDSVLKRELTIGGEPYTLTISPEGFSLTIKGHRKGLDIAWTDLVGGDAALATALNASLTANIAPRGESAAPKPKARSAAPAKIDPATIFLPVPKTGGRKPPNARSNARKKLGAARPKPVGKKQPAARPKGHASRRASARRR